MSRTKRDEAVDAAQDEARELLRSMRADLEALAGFLEAEEAHFERKAPSAKRVARLRLMAQDLASARSFSSKSMRG